MQEFLKILLASGQKGFELAFFILMPIMVFMMAVMRVLEQTGVLRRVAILAAPVLLVFGIPGLGVFAILQILFVSFAAPVSTFRIMDQDAAISDRKLAAGFAVAIAAPGDLNDFVQPGQETNHPLKTDVHAVFDHLCGDADDFLPGPKRLDLFQHLLPMVRAHSG